MPVHKSVEKKERQDVVRRERNRIQRSKVNTALRRLNDAIISKNKEEIEKCLRTYMSEVHKAVKNKVFHKNKGARRISNISKKISSVVVPEKQ